MYSPALFFLSSATSASRPITKFLITICSKSCPTIEKLSERTVCVQSREFLDGWNNLCIPACLKFNYKRFIPTSLGRRLFGPAHKKRVGCTTMYSPALFFLSSATSASRPASNLITKGLFPHPPAGAYSALPIKREWNVLPCTVPLSFFCPVPPLHPGLSRNF